METLEFFFDIDASTIRNWGLAAVGALIFFVITVIKTRFKTDERAQNWQQAASRLGLDADTDSGKVLGETVQGMAGQYRDRTVEISRRREQTQRSSSSLRDIDESMVQTGDRARRKRNRHRRERDDGDQRSITVIEVELTDDGFGNGGIQKHRYRPEAADDGVDALESRYNLFGSIPERIRSALGSPEGLETLDQIEETFDNFEIKDQRACFEVFETIEETGRMVLTTNRAVDMAESLDLVVNSRASINDSVADDERMFRDVD